jgi:hypothetical protein
MDLPADRHHISFSSRRYFSRAAIVLINRHCPNEPNRIISATITQVKFPVNRVLKPLC